MSRATLTWGELRRDAEAQLRAMGVSDPGAEAQWMIEAVSGMDSTEQLIESATPVTHRPTAGLDALLARRAAGEPVQYVLGEWDFCGLDLLVDRRVLIPRPETEIVAEIAIREVERLGERVGTPEPWSGGLTQYAVADLGTGSGALALALAASLPDAEVWATDTSADALAVVRANGGIDGNAPTRRRRFGVRRVAGRDARPLAGGGVQPAVHRGRRSPPLVRARLGAGWRTVLGSDGT